MQWENHEVGTMQRKWMFPFHVSSLYYGWNLIAENIKRTMPSDRFEVSIRLESDAPLCLDQINGVTCKIPFPNIILKKPGQEFILNSPLPRNTMAYIYPVETMMLFEKIGFLPEKNFWHFKMNAEVEKLISDFRKCIYNLYTAGTADHLDWICFKLLRELCELSYPVNLRKQEDIIQNIAVWFQMHYDEDFSMDEIATRNGMSRATFFRLWQKFFSISPVQYILQLKLEAAAILLKQTQLSVARVAQNVNFHGMDAFYKKFHAKYGVTPAEYRIQDANKERIGFIGKSPLKRTSSAIYSKPGLK